MLADLIDIVSALKLFYSICSIMYTHVLAMYSGVFVDVICKQVDASFTDKWPLFVS